MKRNLLKKIRLTLIGGKATPVPPVSKLNEYKINVNSFCKEYNNLTNNFLNIKIPVEIFIFKDKSFRLEIKTPLTSFLLLKNSDIIKGSGEAKQKKIAKVSLNQIKEIARIKLKDLNTKNIDQAINIIKGSAKSIGLEII